MTTRPLFEIAREIKTVWPSPYFGAVPYIEAMSQLRDASDTYGYDDAKGIVLYFLSNASTWRGPGCPPDQGRAQGAGQVIEVVVTALPPGFAISREWARSRPTYTLWLHGCVVSTGPDMYPLRWQANRMAAPTTP